MAGGGHLSAVNTLPAALLCKTAHSDAAWSHRVPGGARRGSCGDEGNGADGFCHPGRRTEETQWEKQTEQERKQTSKQSCAQNKGPAMKQFTAP